MAILPDHRLNEFYLTPAYLVGDIPVTKFNLGQVPRAKWFQRCLMGSRRVTTVTLWPHLVAVMILISDYSFHLSSQVQPQNILNNWTSAICSKSAACKRCSCSGVLGSCQTIGMLRFTLKWIFLWISFGRKNWFLFYFILFLCFPKDTLLFCFSSGWGYHGNKVGHLTGVHLCCLASYGSLSSEQIWWMRHTYRWRLSDLFLDCAWQPLSWDSKGSTSQTGIHPSSL